MSEMDSSLDEDEMDNKEKNSKITLLELKMKKNEEKVGEHKKRYELKKYTSYD